MCQDYLELAKPQPCLLLLLHLPSSLSQLPLHYLIGGTRALLEWAIVRWCPATVGNNIARLNSAHHHHHRPHLLSLKQRRSRPPYLVDCSSTSQPADYCLVSVCLHRRSPLCGSVCAVYTRRVEPLPFCVSRSPGDSQAEALPTPSTTPALLPQLPLRYLVGDISVVLERGVNWWCPASTGNNTAHLNSTPSSSSASSSLAETEKIAPAIPSGLLTY